MKNFNCYGQAGFTEFVHISLADMGIEKGKSPVTDKSEAKIDELVKSRIIKNRI